MTISDFAIVFATLLGPVLAIQAQRWIEVHRERRRAKDQIFRTLMATRAASLSQEHVRALNLIELEFGRGKKEKAIMEAWRSYHAHLNTRMSDDEAWGNRRLDLFIDLLHEMAKYLEYPFDKTQIRTSVYALVAHGAYEEEAEQIRKLLLKLLKGESSLPVSEGPPRQPKPQPPPNLPPRGIPPQVIPPPQH
jgi:hypothetical protein